MPEYSQDPPRGRVSRWRRLGLVIGLAVAAAECSSTSVVPIPDGLLPLGNWGGDSSAMIVSDTAMHIHVACTYGDVSGRIPVGPDGKFDVAGSYMLRAFPIAVGPTVPARFVGQASGTRATVTVTVNDTVTHTIVTRGPVTVDLGRDPRLMPCPICRRPVITRRGPAGRAPKA